MDDKIKQLKKRHPAGITIGSLSDATAERLEDIMNATMRECVFFGSLLDSGDLKGALDALLQIHVNATQSLNILEESL